MQILRVEPTPNPNAVKFVVDANLGAAAEFADQQAAQDNDLAKALFEIDGIDTVFLNQNFITISMTQEAEWHVVHSRVHELILRFEPPVVEAPEGAEGADGINQVDKTKQGALLEQITQLLQERVMPALAADGGGLQVVDLEDKTLTIRYQGACGTCPSAIAGTLGAIENLLKSEVDPEIRVVPAGMGMPY
ncbi:MAG: thioredoxin [Planctomycetota bacterium]|nr:MAG: thioredoxin [Planctomycetota bacterium]